MKKLFLLFAGCALGIFLMVSFKESEITSKQYVTIVQYGGNITITEGGSAKAIKSQGTEYKSGDNQGQVIKLINEYETKGYQLKQYDIGASGGAGWLTSAILYK